MAGRPPGLHPLLLCQEGVKVKKRKEKKEKSGSGINAAGILLVPAAGLSRFVAGVSSGLRSGGRGCVRSGVLLSRCPGFLPAEFQSSWDLLQFTSFQ